MSADEESLARHLIGAARASRDELALHGRTAVRFRMHPLDAESIVAGLFGEDALARQGQLDVLSLPVERDEDVQLGMPVAEFEA